MGFDAACTLTTAGRTRRGTAHLERTELIFQGEGTRLVIPLPQIHDLVVRDGTLLVSYAGQRAVLELGASAEKWAGRIRMPPSRAQKLGIKAGMRVGLRAVDDEDLLRELAQGGAIVERDPGASGLDLLFFGVAQTDDLEQLASLAARLAPAGAIWLLRAKGRGAPVREADCMAAGRRAGLVDVKVVSFSASHTAEKYVIPVERRAGGALSARSRARRSRAQGCERTPGR